MLPFFNKGLLKNAPNQILQTFHLAVQRLEVFEFKSNRAKKVNRRGRQEGAESAKGLRIVDYGKRTKRLKLKISLRPLRLHCGLCGKIKIVTKAIFQSIPISSFNWDKSFLG